jgi:hypothetical protein
MANQITPKQMLQIQLHDWKVYLAQIEKNPDTPTTDLAFCKGQIERIEASISSISEQSNA